MTSLNILFIVVTCGHYLIFNSQAPVGKESLAMSVISAVPKEEIVKIILHFMQILLIGMV